MRGNTRRAHARLRRWLLSLPIVAFFANEASGQIAAMLPDAIPDYTRCAPFGPSGPDSALTPPVSRPPGLLNTGESVRLMRSLNERLAELGEEGTARDTIAGQHVPLLMSVGDSVSTFDFYRRYPNTEVVRFDVPQRLSGWRLLRYLDVPVVPTRLNFGAGAAGIAGQVIWIQRLAPLPRGRQHLCRGRTVCLFSFVGRAPGHSGRATCVSLGGDRWAHASPRWSFRYPQGSDRLILTHGLWRLSWRVRAGRRPGLRLRLRAAGVRYRWRRASDSRRPSYAATMSRLVLVTSVRKISALMRVAPMLASVNAPGAVRKEPSL